MAIPIPFVPCHCEERSDVAIRIPLVPCHCEEHSDVAIRIPFVPFFRVMRGKGERIATSLRSSQ